MKIPCHHCLLTEKELGHEGAAKCEKIKADEICLSGLTEFN
jgi:hypothetical protein